MKKNQLINLNSDNPKEEKSIRPRLIPDPSSLKEEATFPKNLFFCNIANIIPNKEQVRKTFNEETIRELAKSIQEKGILQPLLVHRISESKFEIIAGERRWRAAKIVGLKRVPVMTRESSDVDLLEVGLIENIQRENLTDIEEARAYKKLIDEYKYTQEELAQIIGKKRSTVANSLRLLALPKSIQDLLAAKKISAGHARALLSSQGKEEQEKKAKQIVQGKLSVRQAESLTKTKSQSSACGREAFHISISANTISKMLRTKVRINKIGKKGNVVIEFNGESEFYRIISLLKKKCS